MLEEKIDSALELELRELDEFEHLSSLVQYPGSVVEPYAFYDIWARDDWIRDELSQIKSLIPRIRTSIEISKRKKGLGREASLLAVLFSNKHLSGMLRHTNYAASELISQWDLVTYILWNFYQMESEENEINIFKILKGLRDNEELKPFFDEVGVYFKGGSVRFKEGSHYMALREYSNSFRHRVMGIIKVEYLDAYVQAVSRGETPTVEIRNHKGEKEIPIMGPLQRTELIADSYTNFVRSYNVLLGILDTKLAGR